jgi:hypothetical protein
VYVWLSLFWSAKTTIAPCHNKTIKYDKKTDLKGENAQVIAAGLIDDGKKKGKTREREKQRISQKDINTMENAVRGIYMGVKMQLEYKRATSPDGHALWSIAAKYYKTTKLKSFSQ